MKNRKHFMIIFLVSMLVFTADIGKRKASSAYADTLIPSQDIVTKALQNKIVILVGNPNAYTNNTKIKINAENLNIVPVNQNGNILVPKDFILNQFNVAIPDNATYQLNNEFFISLSALVKAINKNFYLDESGLVVIGDNLNDFIKDTDKSLIHEVIKMLVYDRPDADKIIADLKNMNTDFRHPRIMVTPETVEKIKGKISTDPLIKSWYEEVILEANKLLKEPTLKYHIPDGRRLKVEREIKIRIPCLAFAYMISGEAKYAERAWKELEEGANFPDWNHSREFLNTAGMCEAFTIGYDWLYSYWTEEQKAIIRNALIEKGLKPGLQAFRGRAWWVYRPTFISNWTAVCNSGLGLAALAIGDEQEEIAGEIIEASLRSLKDSLLMEYLPDGGWGEGTGYWRYSFTNLVTYLSALNTALGTDYGYSDTPGLHQSAYFPINLIGPAGSFNFADTGVGIVNTPHQFWIASKKKDADLTGIRLAFMMQRKIKATIEDIIWYDRGCCNASFLNTMEDMPKDKYYRKTEVVTLRSGWDDLKRINFVGFKGGSAWGSHCHLDIGTFVLDAGGQRWVHDLGSDDYGLPGYFEYEKERFFYHRLGPEGHNTIIINPGKGLAQDIKATAKVQKFESKPSGGMGIIDMSDVYAKNAKSIKRGFMLSDDRSKIIVQDEVITKVTSDIQWQVYTKADIEMINNGKAVILSQGGQKLWVGITSSQDSTFVIDSASPHPSSLHAAKQEQNNDFHKLIIPFKNVKALQLSVTFMLIKPGTALPVQLQDIIPLKDWEIPNEDNITKTIDSSNIQEVLTGDELQKVASEEKSVPLTHVSSVDATQSKKFQHRLTSLCIALCVVSSTFILIKNIYRKSFK